MEEEDKLEFIKDFYNAYIDTQCRIYQTKPSQFRKELIMMYLNKKIEAEKKYYESIGM
jgi:hypothetical protein